MPAEGPLRLAFLGDPNSIHIRRWVTFFSERGHRVTLLVDDDVEVGPGLAPAIAIERFAAVSVKGRFPPASLVRAYRSVRRVVKRVDPDVLNAHFLTVHGWQGWLSGFHPFVATLWGSDIFITPKRYRVAALLSKATLRAADMIMVNSEMLSEAAKALGAPTERTEMIQFGVDLSRFTAGPDPTALRDSLGLQGKRVIFSPRGITPLYRHEVVIHALASLPADVAVLMSRFRAQSSELEALMNLAKALGLSDRIVIVDEIGHEQMPDYYRLADVVVSVPMSDSTSVTLLEAL
ncbi:MAG: glycosyltransferase, partial [Candidatus Limnocylindrales bacterium]